MHQLVKSDLAELEKIASVNQTSWWFNVSMDRLRLLPSPDSTRTGVALQANQQFSKVKYRDS